MAQRLAFSIAETAETVGLSERKMRQLLVEGTIASLKVGSRRLVPRRALEKWLEDGVGSDSANDPPDALARSG